jgi:hypothetical protein
MPHMCFSYPADGSAGTPNRDSTRATPLDLRRMPVPCFSYPQTCFGYPDDGRLGTGNGDAAQPDLHRMPLTCCFRY